ncbi:MAG: LysR family transcriptional regulator [Phormidesmis sp.]
MNLRQLRYFLAVASELHFGRAASKLHMAQPPLSTQIKQLEADLGVVLFHRTKRRVALTTAGKTLQLEAQQILDQLTLAKHKTQQASRGEIGQITIAFVSSAMYSILPTWLLKFRQQYPAVNLILKEATGLEQIEGLLSHRIDVGFMHPPVPDEKVVSQRVWQEPWLLALPKNHKLSKHSQISIADLNKEDFILVERALATEMHDKFISFCAQAGFSPNVVQTAEQLQTILGLVAAQMGISILPSATQKLQREGVCYRPFMETTPTSELIMIRRNEASFAALNNFVKMCPEVLHAL